ncbi:hypothetical protein WA026_003509 [Henosepilachna vigintioctopunctata]|uniref:Uncharacterized protein n=1 Tax=Henosepilachna vigintioctopunctata TaxID=420089 RepID=A0AAW1TP16_9CUCU
MKSSILLSFFCVSVSSLEHSGRDKILEYRFEKHAEGPYSYRFQTAQGVDREETAERLYEGTEFETLFLRGSYQYYGPDQKLYTITYTADDNGFHPEGEHIEVPPYVPWPSKIELISNTDTTTEYLQASRYPQQPNSLNQFRNPKRRKNSPSSELLEKSVDDGRRPSIYLTTPKTIYQESMLEEKSEFGDFKAELPSRKRLNTQPMKKFHIATSTLPPRIEGNFLESQNRVQFFSQRSPGVFTSPKPPNHDSNFIPGVTNRYIPSTSESPKEYQDEAEISKVLANFDSNKNSNVILFGSRIAKRDYRSKIAREAGKIQKEPGLDRFKKT